MAELTSKDVNDIIVAKTDEILGIVDLSVSLRAALTRENVITPALADDLDVAGLSGHGKIQLILKSISKRGVEPFVKFCKVLNEKDHKHVLNVLGVVVQGNNITLCKESGQQGPTKCAGTALVRTAPAGLPSEDELDELFEKNLDVFNRLDMNAVFLNYLSSAGVITHEMVQKINSKPTDADKVQELMINQLPKRGEQSKQLFLKCMLKSKQVHLLKKIGLNDGQIEQLKHLE